MRCIETMLSVLVRRFPPDQDHCQALILHKTCSYPASTRLSLLTNRFFFLHRQVILAELVFLPLIDF